MTPPATKKFSAVMLVLGLLTPHSVHSEQFGAWLVGTEVDNMTDQKTYYAVGHGENVQMTILCDILTYGPKELSGRRDLRVDFKTTEYLGVGGGRPPPVLFKVDQRPALKVIMRGYFPKNVAGVYSGTPFVEKLLEQPAKEVRLRFTTLDYSNKYEYTIPLDGMAQAVSLLKNNCGMTPQNTWRSKEKDDSITVP